MGTSRLKVVLDDKRSYDIRIGSGLLSGLGAELGELTSVRKAVIITDSNVGPLYAAKLRATLQAGGFEAYDLSIPAGEASKAVEVAAELWEAMAHLGLGRDSLVVALGGGVVGDIAGFVASTYMRGVGYVQVPTTLLAMVDSSVGGKTAINIRGGKNLVGSFYQPLYVLVDLDTLVTLPPEQWPNGYAEIAKSAIIDGGEFYAWLCANASALVAKDLEALQRAVVQSLTFKARVVVADEREAGLRECLNYGHTFAHALEAASNFEIPHGRAVAEGMRFAVRLAVEACAVEDEAGATGAGDEAGAAVGGGSGDAAGAVAGGGSSVGAGALAADTGGVGGVGGGVVPSFVGEQDLLLTKLGLESIGRSYAADELFDLMRGDKKVRGGKMRFIFAKQPGDWQIIAVDEDLVKIYIILWEQARM